MIKRLAFVAGVGVGFVLGSASGRKSYESLRETALNTWNDPKVQEKVNQGAEWAKTEVPVVGNKIADSAQKTTEAVKEKAQEGADAAKDKAQAVKEKAQDSKSNETPKSGTAATTPKSVNDVSKNAAGNAAATTNSTLPKPVTTDKNVDLNAAKPRPNTGNQKF